MVPILDFVRAYPAFAGSVLGFTGVIITLIVNAWLARRQDERREMREARAVRVAIIEELRVQKRALETAVETLGADPAGSAVGLLPVERYMGVFDALTNKIGALDPRASLLTT